jgi:hypothetical protein
VVNTTGLRPTGHAAPYQTTGPTPTPPSPINQSTHNLQPVNSYKCTQLTPKSASVVPPEEGCLTPKTRRGLRHNKVTVKVNEVGYVTVILVTTVQNHTLGEAR